MEELVDPNHTKDLIHIGHERQCVSDVSGSQINTSSCNSDKKDGINSSSLSLDTSCIEANSNSNGSSSAARTEKLELYGEKDMSNDCDDHGSDCHSSRNSHQSNPFIFVKAENMEPIEWEYFGFYKCKESEEVLTDRTMCKLCHRLVTYSGSSTDDMQQHLINVHSFNKSFFETQEGSSDFQQVSMSLSAEGFDIIPPPPKLRSFVWQYFSFCKRRESADSKYDKAWCKLCNEMLQCNSDQSTSCMASHLMKHHKMNLHEHGQSKDDKVVENPSKYEFVPVKDDKALVWTYFGFYKVKGTDEIKKDCTICKLCGHMIKYHQGSTTSMATHLKHNHDINVLKNPCILPNSTEEGSLSGGCSKENDQLAEIAKHESVDEYVFVEVNNVKEVIWNFFGFYKVKDTDETHTDKVMCKFCKDVVKYVDNNTNHMKQHLTNVHMFSENALKLMVFKHSKKSPNTHESVVQLSSGDFDIFQPSSPVWLYFGYSKEKKSTQTELDRNWCKLCNQVLINTAGSKRRMLSHLATHHKIQIGLKTSAPIKKIYDVSNSVFENAKSNFEVVPVRKQFKAIVWKYFGFYKTKGTNDIKTDYTCCRLCGNFVKYSKGSTSMMKKHLKTYHDIDIGRTNSNFLNVNANNALVDVNGIDKGKGSDYGSFVEANEMRGLEWKHFGFYKINGSEEVCTDKAMCRFCNKLIDYLDDSTVDMQKHLFDVHGFHRKALEEVSLHDSSAHLSSSPLSVDKNLLSQMSVWKYFSDCQENRLNQSVLKRISCKLCNQTLLYSGNNTTKLRFHLAKHHAIKVSPRRSRLMDPFTSSYKEMNVSGLPYSNYEFVPLKKPRKDSVWQYFGFYKLKGTSQVRKDYTCCKLCKYVSKYTSGCTSLMKEHLQNFHGIDVHRILFAAKSRKQQQEKFKKLVCQQFCKDARCGRSIKLESDGSPPQFCAGCGNGLSEILAPLWKTFDIFCKTCGKLIVKSDDATFCTRCGSRTPQEVVPVTKHMAEGDVMPVVIKQEHEEDITVPIVESENIARDSTVPMEVKQEYEDHDLGFSTSADDRGKSYEGNPFHCKVCCYKASSKKDLDKHYQTAHRSQVQHDLLKCDVCQYQTSYLPDFTEHAKIHLNSDVNIKDLHQPNFLSAFDDQTDRLHGLIEHIKVQKQASVISEDLPLQHSDDTSQNANMTHSTKKTFHLKRVSAKTITRYCKVCNNVFKSLEALKHHMLFASCTPTMLTCEECGFITDKFNSLRGHKRRNHGNIVLKKCNYCDKTFKRQRNLDEHMNTHTGSTPFQCDKCGKAFHTNSSWYKHKRNNCQQGPRDRKLCSHCGKSVFNLSKHISDVHFNIKAFCCPTCKKSFGTQYHLDRHARIHTGEKPYACQFCDYRASQKVVTDNHMKRCKNKPAS